MLFWMFVCLFVFTKVFSNTHTAMPRIWSCRSDSCDRKEWNHSGFQGKWVWCSTIRVSRTLKNALNFLLSLALFWVQPPYFSQYLCTFTFLSGYRKIYRIAFNISLLLPSSPLCTSFNSFSPNIEIVLHKCKRICSLNANKIFTSCSLM